MVHIDDLIKALSDPEMIARVAEESRKMAIIAGAQYRCRVQDMNNEFDYLRMRQEAARGKRIY
jgi:hypothetical protein